ncbi:MAG TPA: hypothetical protein VJ694_02110 [Patescibacteria group bacterium]|nr:hypothetical protein [Patescibacteria group bacterium]
MPLHLALLMAATAALLAVAVCGVLWRGWADGPSAAPVGRPVEPPRATATTVSEAYAPPEGSLFASQLEVGQTFHLQTSTAKYALTLRDPVTGLYDAVRHGRKRDGTVATEPFRMLFKGTFVPNRGLRFREFVLGGNLCYQKIRGGDVLDVTPSSPVLRILFIVGERSRQAA